jgi:hypothetical protein
MTEYPERSVTVDPWVNVRRQLVEREIIPKLDTDEEKERYGTAVLQEVTELMLLLDDGEYKFGEMREEIAKLAAELQIVELSLKKEENTVTRPIRARLNSEGYGADVDFWFDNPLGQDTVSSQHQSHTGLGFEDPTQRSNFSWSPSRTKEAICSNPDDAARLAYLREALRLVKEQFQPSIQDNSPSAVMWRKRMKDIQSESPSTRVADQAAATVERGEKTPFDINTAAVSTSAGEHEQEKPTPLHKPITYWINLLRRRR